MSEKSIKLIDFVTEAAKILEWDISIIAPETATKYVCPQCGRTYSEGVKFCSDDAQPIKETTYEIKSAEYDEFMSKMMYELSEGGGTPEGFSYEHVDNIEKRGDGSGYYMNFVFKRKSDGKYFYYTSYDGRVQGDTLDECEAVVTTSWDFERHFS